MPTNNNQTLTSVNALSNEVWLGGVVTNVSSEKGSKSNPYQTFDEAKSAVAENGVILVNQTIEITDEQQFSIENGAIVKRADNFTRALFLINGGTLTLTNITIDGGNYFSSASLIEIVSGNLILNDNAILQNNYNAYNGGAINTSNNACSIEINNGASIINNTSRNLGGAIYAGNKTSLAINGGTISDNCANFGGALYLNKGRTRYLHYYWKQFYS